MKNKIIFSLLFFTFITFNLLSKEITLPLLNNRDTCQYGPRLWLLDNNDNEKYEYLVYGGCSKNAKIFELIDNSKNSIFNNQNAMLISGSFFNINFLVFIVDSSNSRYTHKLYYDNQISKAVLEDYTEQGNDQTTFEEADNYFYTQQMGSTLLITKKADIDVQSVLLCSLDGRIISNLQNVEGWSQFSIDMSLEPSGMYLLRFIARDRAMTKRVIYIR